MKTRSAHPTHVAGLGASNRHQVLVQVGLACFLMASTLGAAELARTKDKSGPVASEYVDDQTPAGQRQQQPAESIVITSIGDDEQTAPGAKESALVTGVGNRHRYEQQPAGALAAAGQESPNQTLADTAQAARPEPRHQQEGSNFDQQQQEPATSDHTAPTSTQSPASSSTTTSTSSPPVQQAQPAAYVAQAAPGQWGPASYAASQAGQQQQQFGSLMSGSNQVISVQHPTSINSIINEQQQQQQQPAQGQQQQAQMVSLNGQPVILVPSATAGLLAGQGGRRISISGWLRGLSSMLANIFNRREHGPALQMGTPMQQQQPAAAAPSSQLLASGSSPAGHWLNLGPNAPHWLTQAQSAIQQLQQQAASGSNRYTTFIQAPLSQGTASGTQMQPTTATIAFALPPQALAPSSSSSISTNYQQIGDLQASASSSSYATIQPLAGLAPNHHHYQSGPLVVGQLQAAAPSQQQHVVMGPMSRPTETINGAKAQHTQVAGANEQRVSASQSPHQVRFGRSSRQPTGFSSTGSNNANSQVQNNGNNLPLAHYSQHADGGSD